MSISILNLYQGRSQRQISPVLVNQTPRRPHHRKRASNLLVVVVVRVNLPSIAEMMMTRRIPRMMTNLENLIPIPTLQRKDAAGVILTRLLVANLQMMTTQTTLPMLIVLIQMSLQRASTDCYANLIQDFAAILIEIRKQWMIG